ncbi:SKP1-like protein 1A, partial [Tanacetum coccineum]
APAYPSEQPPVGHAPTPAADYGGRHMYGGNSGYLCQRKPTREVLALSWKGLAYQNAAAYLKIKSLVALMGQNVAEMIKGKSPEELRGTSRTLISTLAQPTQPEKKKRKMTPMIESGPMVKNEVTE